MSDVMNIEHINRRCADIRAALTEKGYQNVECDARIGFVPTSNFMVWIRHDPPANLDGSKFFETGKPIDDAIEQMDIEKVFGRAVRYVEALPRMMTKTEAKDAALDLIERLTNGGQKALAVKIRAAVLS